MLAKFSLDFQLIPSWFIRPVVPWLFQSFPGLWLNQPLFQLDLVESIMVDSTAQTFPTYIYQQTRLNCAFGLPISAKMMSPPNLQVCLRFWWRVWKQYCIISNELVTCQNVKMNRSTWQPESMKGWLLELLKCGTVISSGPLLHDHFRTVLLCHSLMTINTLPIDTVHNNHESVALAQ